MLIALPLYPNTIDGFVYSVNLLNYKEMSPVILRVYWIAFVLLFVFGVAEVVLTKSKKEKANKSVTEISLVFNIFLVVFLALKVQYF